MRERKEKLDAEGRDAVSNRAMKRDMGIQGTWREYGTRRRWH